MEMTDAIKYIHWKIECRLKRDLESRFLTPMRQFGTKWCDVQSVYSCRTKIYLFDSVWHSLSQKSQVKKFVALLLVERLRPRRNLLAECALEERSAEPTRKPMAGHTYWTHSDVICRIVKYLPMPVRSVSTMITYQNGQAYPPKTQRTALPPFLYLNVTFVLFQPMFFLF